VVGGSASADPRETCALSDRRLAETSGLAWSPEGLLTVDDSGNLSTVYRLDARCAVVGTRAVPTPGRDVEDLARAGDGTLWLSDTGDNDRARATVAVLRLPPGGGERVTRLVYPDGPHDAESLLLPADGRPVIVTKDLGGRSGVYTTDASLPPGPGPVPLRRAGTVVVPPTSTLGGPTPFGGGLYTGGAMSADGRVAALRTYTDAWLYPIADPGSADGVVAALGTEPVRVPLPGEPQGEAITFAPDGALFSAGESPEGTRATVRVVPGAAGLVAAHGSGASSAASSSPVPVPPSAGPARAGSPIGPGLLEVLAAVVLGGLAVVGLVLVGRRGRAR
jgi:hypothetical protein